MQSIQYQDKYVTEANFRDCAAALAKLGAKPRTPIKTAVSSASKETDAVYLLLRDVVIEFDGEKVESTDVESIMNEYGFKRRL